MIAVDVEESRSGVHDLVSRADRPQGDGLTVIDATKLRELNDNRGTD